ncbi:hypothetical protein KP509_26G005300 [Ceratopteris richardii]|uniref:Uncharacterized protein n=1 Tax=Ceratopteris richardii TaxID=49495 RepID=A0A8T2RHZ9_CERRI|nr:hypothetical protein KP509_26G005300 [Ceratopteris richardii]
MTYKLQVVIFTSQFQHILQEEVKLDKFISLSSLEDSRGNLYNILQKQRLVKAEFKVMTNELWWTMSKGSEGIMEATNFSVDFMECVNDVGSNVRLSVQTLR